LLALPDEDGPLGFVPVLRGLLIPPAAGVADEDGGVEGTVDDTQDLDLCSSLDILILFSGVAAVAAADDCVGNKNEGFLVSRVAD
jgi:hypothetical protein